MIKLRLLVFIPFLAALCYGHAHIFIEYKVHFCVDDSGLKGVFVNWTFDRMFTAFIKKEYDVDKNNELNKNEQAALFTTAFKSLEKNDYFVVMSVNGRNLPVPEPQRFSARIIKETDMASYTFYLPLDIPSTEEAQSFEIYFFDPVIYVAFTTFEKDLGLQNLSKKIQASLQMKTVKHVNRPTISFREG
ncbi:MAG: DUF1007 family protein [Chitinispirillaceae bacterium]|nr:DUF1007 family protein [Chitinispirillaceae bacterium]